MGVVKLADYRHNPVQHQEASSMGYVSTGTVYCIQANGAIYDTDQQSAEMRRREREEPQSKKKGGF